MARAVGAEVTRALLLVVSLAITVGCSFADEREASRVDRCVDRLLSRAEPETLTAERRPVLERYARETYCERFDREGWVYADGTLSIDVHRWLTAGGSEDCEGAEAGKPPRDVPCPPDPMLECALLHHVPKAEVQAYLRELQRTRKVECDDGTPLDELGVG